MIAHGSFYHPWEHGWVVLHQLFNLVKGKVSRTPFPASRVQRHLHAVSKQIEAAGFQDHLDAITNPLRDYRLLLIGDSKTWGCSAGGHASTRPRQRRLSDPRNNFWSPSWANLLLAELGRTLYGERARGKPKSDGAGSWHWTKPISLKLTDEDCVSIYGADEKPKHKKAGTVTGSVFPSTLKVGAGQYAQFSCHCPRFDIVYAEAPYDPAAKFTVEVNGEIISEKAFFNKSFVPGRVLRVRLPNIASVVRIKNHGRRTLHIETIRRTKCVGISNQGIYGSKMSEWVPEGHLLPGAVAPTDTHALIALGTNGRSSGSIESNRRHLIRIVHHLRARSIAPILAADSAVRQDQDVPYLAGAKFGLSDIRMLVASLARDEHLPFVDWYTITHAKLRSGSVLHANDGIHENNAGHRVKFEYLWHALTSDGK